MVLLWKFIYTSLLDLDMPEQILGWFSFMHARCTSGLVVEDGNFVYILKICPLSVSASYIHIV